MNVQMLVKVTLRDACSLKVTFTALVTDLC